MSPWGSDCIFTRSDRAGAWRAVSEDPARTSSSVRARCLPFAFMRVGKPHDPFEPVRRQVLLPPHRTHDVGEALRSRHALTTSGWCSKNGSDRRLQVGQARRPRRSDTLLARPFDRTRPQPKKRDQRFEHRSMPLVLGHLEDRLGAASRGCAGRTGSGGSRRRSNLLRRRSPRPSADRARARPLRFPADCPHRSDCHCPSSHLLREGVTMNEYRRIHGVFQHIARFCNGQLRLTVIVTAAVYRGLGSELRPCGLTLPRNLPAPGRRHSVYIVLRLRTLLCF